MQTIKLIASPGDPIMSTTLALQIDESLLPLSNMIGTYFPFMLDTGRVFAT